MYPQSHRPTIMDGQVNIQGTIQQGSHMFDKPASTILDFGMEISVGQEDHRTLERERLRQSILTLEPGMVGHPRDNPIIRRIQQGLHNVHTLFIGKLAVGIVLQDHTVRMLVLVSQLIQVKG